MTANVPVPGHWVAGASGGWFDAVAVGRAVAAQAGRPTPGIADMAAYLDAQVADESHREVVGPLLPGTGASGLVVHRGKPVAGWGDPAAVEMCFSATKSILAVVAGVAFGRGLIADLHRPVTADVSHPLLRGMDGITWHHLLQQTSGWDGELWGKPARADAQSGQAGTPCPDPAGPGTAWAYNDVRVNLLCLALTVLWQRPLPQVLGEEILAPLGASTTWAWHGYRGAVVQLATGETVPVVSAGAHWGGGLWMSAADLALVGGLHLRQGRWHGRQLISQEWIERAWQPSTANPDYGYLWWLNGRRRIFPNAPATGRCARGNGGRHLLWIDPARELVVTSHWGEEIGRFLEDVSAAIPVSST